MQRSTRRVRVLSAVAITTAAAAVVVAGIVVAGPVSASERPNSPASAGPAVSAQVLAARAREVKGVDQILTGRITTVTPSAGAVAFAYAGDSITARPGSWLRDLAMDRNLDAVGGYAHSGYRTDQVLADMPTVSGEQVLVVELGTNDINQAVPTDRIVRNIETLVAKVGAPHVLLVAAPPDDHTSSLWGADRRAGSAALNVRFRALAAAHRWSFADPFAADRLADNGYRPGTTLDGIHPTSAANVGISRAFAAAIARAAA
jgi:hypothetical protein